MFKTIVSNELKRNHKIEFGIVIVQLFTLQCDLYDSSIVAITNDSDLCYIKLHEISDNKEAYIHLHASARGYIQLSKRDADPLYTALGICCRMTTAMNPNEKEASLINVHLQDFYLINKYKREKKVNEK